MSIKEQVLKKLDSIKFKDLGIACYSDSKYQHFRKEIVDMDKLVKRIVSITEKLKIEQILKGIKEMKIPVCENCLNVKYFIIKELKKRRNSCLKQPTYN